MGGRYSGTRWDATPIMVMTCQRIWGPVRECTDPTSSQHDSDAYPGLKTTLVKGHATYSRSSGTEEWLQPWALKPQGWALPLVSYASL